MALDNIYAYSKLDWGKIRVYIRLDEPSKISIVKNCELVPELYVKP